MNAKVVAKGMEFHQAAYYNVCYEYVIWLLVTFPIWYYSICLIIGNLN